MKIIFAFLLLILLVFSGYHLSFRKFGIPLLERTFYLTGLEFLFLGVLLGPHFINVLDPDTCRGLTPITALLLGWIGMLFGFQFEISKLRRLPGVNFIAGLLESLLTLVVVSGGFYFLLPFIHDTGGMRLGIAIVAGSAAACTAQTGLAMIPAGSIRKNRSLIKTLRYLSSIDGLVAMLALVPVFMFSHFTPPTMEQGMMAERHIFPVVIFFAAVILLYNLLLIHRREQSELALIIIGMIIFISGFASLMNFSPLLANFFVGVCLVNLTSEKEKIFMTLVSIEKPVYLLLLVFLGSAWYLEDIFGLIMAAGYFGLRLTGKMIGGFSVSMIGRKVMGAPPGLGLGLIGQGGLSLAILLDFQQGFASTVADQVVGIILTAIILNEAIRPIMADRLLTQEGHATDP